VPVCEIGVIDPDRRRGNLAGTRAAAPTHIYMCAAQPCPSQH
jgi:hypothetical protein